MLYTDHVRKFLTVKKLLVLAAVIIAGLLIVFMNPREVLSPVTDYGTEPEAPAEPTFNKAKYSTDDPDSIWVIVSKVHPVSPIDFVPKELVTPDVFVRSGGEEGTLRKGAAKALEKMFAAAEKDGQNMMMASGYRSYSLQEVVYHNEQLRFGQAVADAQSARPGHSEHQTGLVADIADAAGACVIDDCFGETSQYKWLDKNAHNYGYIQRYVDGKQAVTGYRTEPWHWRFVGVELAKEMNRSGVQTLEEFFNMVPESQPW